MQRYFVCETNRAPYSYQPGEEIVFTVFCREDGMPSAFEATRWELKGDFGLDRSGIIEGQSVFSLTALLPRPGFVYLHLLAQKKDGTVDETVHVYHGGAGVGIGSLTPVVPKPADYDEFWLKTKEEMNAVAPAVLSQKKMPQDPEHPNHDLYDIRIACAGGIPVSGFLSVPRGEEKLGGRVIFQGYGVKSAWHDFGEGEMQLCVNAHGIENDMPDAYYAFLSNGKYKDYGFDEKENQSPDTCYFKAMMQRAGQAFRFLTSHPRWDGEHLTAWGGSQGAVQSMHAAWLVPEVKTLDIFVPWLCDTRAGEIGRYCHWEKMQTPAFPYFDLALRAPAMRCEVKVRAGLGDYTSPPAGVTAMVNSLETKKNFVLVQGMEHLIESPEAKEYTVL